MDFSIIWTIIVSIIVFGVLIFVHELGHFLAARWAKIKVLEFAMGMGKEIFGWEKGGTRFTLRIFPLGGFCRLYGDDPENPEQDPEGSFHNSPWHKRFVVMAAGSVMNFVLGVVLFFLIFF
jgi:regulator of sigma E protease